MKICLITFLATVCSATFLIAAPGDVDPNFNLNLNGTAFATAVLPEGKILVGGSFSGGTGGAAILLARLHADGTRDVAFDPNVSGPAGTSVGAVALQTDGKILVGGNFTTVGGSARSQLARLRADGTLDTSFSPTLNSYAGAIAVQADGKILIGGGFTNVNGSTRNFFARLNANGTLDTTFNPNPNDTVQAIIVQADGRMLVSGGFFNIAGSARSQLVRLNANGTLDSAFNPNPNWVNAVALQADGKILAGGFFANLGGVNREIARFNANGTLDSTFNPISRGTINAVAVQADGRILIEGNGVARLNANGTLDNTFTAGANPVSPSLMVQADGKVLLSSTFTTALTRLLNDPATQSLTVPSANRVSWLRGGAGPEIEQVIFELSTDGGNTYSALGAGTRIAGGWEKTGLSLPANCEIRARGRTTSGFENNCAGLVQALAVTGSVAPEIAVEQPAGTDLADGVSVSFGNGSIGDSGNSLTFTIKNTGTASLTDLGLTIDGPDRAMFAVTARPNAPLPGGGGTTTFTVRFAPTSTGAKSAALHIASNDSDENPFDLTLTGTGALSTNADLSALSMSGGILTPPFTSATTSYATTVGSATSSTAVTPASSGSAATIRVNNVVVASGSPSAPIALNVGANVLTIVVTAGDGVSTKTYTITVTRTAPGFGIGDAEPGFAPSFNGTVSTTEVQSDGKVLVGGFFTSVDGITRNGIARLNADGTLDASFDPNANGSVQASVVQADGKIVIGGGFTSVGGSTRNRLARLLANGSLDTSFNPDVNGFVGSVSVLPDGRLLVGGQFTSVGGIARNLLTRLLANGTVDSAFNANIAGDGVNTANVNAMALQADGKILIGGYFTTVGGISQRTFARLNANGTLDSAYAPSAPSPIYTMVVQADGKAIVTGGDSVSEQVFRFNADGTRDVTFVPNASSFVFSLAVQADGKVLLGGTFTSIGGTARNQLARFNANGTLDITFNPDVRGGGVGVYTLAVQEDGRVLAGGAFTSVGGVARSGFARLINDPAAESLTIPSAQRVQWLRGGASPEAESVSFELSTDVGVTYGALGAGVRIPGGWERTGLSLPAGGEIRARARLANGDGSGLVETLAAFGNAVPEIVVEQPVGTDLADGGGVSFADTPAGEATSLTFTIRNPGTARLTGLGITLDGADAAMFTVTAAPAVMVPGAGGSTTFTVQFLPTSTGAKTAGLHLASNDGDENPFDLTLTGLATISSNPELTALSLSAGTLTPAFASATTSYGATVGHNSSMITVLPVARATATITVNGIAVASGSASQPILLSEHENLVSIVVTAGDGVTRRFYTVAVTRAPLAPGDVDPAFAPDFNGNVVAIAVQPDEKIVFGGDFTTVSGVTRNRVARVRTDGTLDVVFNPDANGTVNAALVQADGRVLLGGAFTSVSSVTRNRLARLDATGALDPLFTQSANADVLALAMQADGRVLLGGTFTSLNGGSRSRIARLESNGALDNFFNPNASSTVNSIAVQAGGRMLVGGAFQGIGGSGSNRIARLFSSGALDATFNPFASDTVLSVAVQPDGKVLLGGTFTFVGGAARNRIARFNANGTIDTAFNPNADNAVSTIALQADGKVILGGSFTRLGGIPRNRLARLQADGTLDAAFNPDASDVVQSVAVQADGRVLVGGTFASMGGVARSRFARLANDPAVQSLTLPDITRVRWLRDGTAPEVEQVTFELSSDAGQTWSALGAGVRIAGGWERTGLTLPASSFIRARGRTVGGAFNATSGLIEQIVSFAPYTPYQQWKFTHLGDAAAPDDGDADGDGLLTLAEYGLNLLPETSSAVPGVTLFTYAEGERLRIFVERDPAHDDVTIEVQASESPAGPWASIATSLLGAPFAGPGYVSGDSATPGVKTIEVRDTVNLADAPSRFLRVRVTH